MEIAEHRYKITLDSHPMSLSGGRYDFLAASGLFAALTASLLWMVM